MSRLNRLPLLLFPGLVFIAAAADPVMPVWKYSTYLSVPGIGEAGISAVAMDKEGDIFLGGACYTVPFIAKLDRSGAFYQWVHILSKDPGICARGGGDPYSGPVGDVGSLAVDEKGALYATGTTGRPQYFPTVNAFRPSPPAGPNKEAGFDAEAFGIRISPDGHIDYSTLIGGSGMERGQGIAIDGKGGAWIVGTTVSTDFLRMGAIFDCAGFNSNDLFAVHLDEAGKPVFASCLGGSKGTAALSDILGLTTDTKGNLYLKGRTRDATITPLTARLKVENPHDLCFVAKVEVDKPQLGYVAPLEGDCNAMQGSGHSAPTFATGGIAVDETGSVVMAFGQFTPRAGNGPQFAHPFLVKYSAEGAPVQKIRVFPDLPASSRPGVLGNLAFGPDGSIYITGMIDEAKSLPGRSWHVAPAPGPNRSVGYLLKLDRSGKALWHMVFPNNSNGNLDIVVRGSEIAITGVTDDGDFPSTPGVAARRLAPNPRGNDWLVRLSEADPASPCKLTTSPGQFYMSNQGAQNQRVFVIPNRGDCPWSIGSEAPWIRATPPSPAAGLGAVRVDVDTNVSGPRKGSLNVKMGSGETVVVPIAQGPVACLFTAAPPFIDVASKRGGALAVMVTAAPGCDWSAKTEASWITLQSPAGNGSGKLLFTLAPNTSGGIRHSMIDIGGTQVPIVQRTADTLAPASDQPRAAPKAPVRSIPKK